MQTGTLPLVSGEQITAEDQVSQPSHGPIRTELGRFAELSSLVGFAVVAPILGAFGESTETFVGVGAGPGDIIRFALIVTFGPLVAIAGLAAATVAFGSRTRGWVQHGLVGLLAGIVAVTLVRQADVGTLGRLLGGLGAAAGAVWLHRNWRPGRLFLRYAAPAPVFFLLVFLFASPVAGLVDPTDVDVDRATASDQPPVVLIVLDELPTQSLVSQGGTIDEALFPNLARLADQSTWYRNNTTVGSRTNVSLPAIVTGNLPAPGPEVDPVLANFPDNILTLLARTHDVHATEWTTQFCPTSICPDDPVELDEDARALLTGAAPDPGPPVPALLDEAASLWWNQAWPSATPERTYTVAGNVEADEFVRPGLEFLSGLTETDSDRPSFDYLHAPLPHQPWRYLPSGDTYDAPRVARGAEYLFWEDSETDGQLAQLARIRHRLQVQWSDRLLGAIMDRLQALDRWDDAVVVVTADHGVVFSQNSPLRGLVPQTQTEIAWTPLFVKAPGVEAGVIDDRNAMTMDIVPTIAEATGIDVPWETDGQSLLGPPRTTDLKPSETDYPEEFGVELAEKRVSLEADGLAAIEAAGRPPDADDPLRVWRDGRHGDLIGRTIDEIGACPADLAPLQVTATPPPTWGTYMDGTLPVGEALPLWHTGTIADDDAHDMALLVDDTVAAWSPARRHEGANDLGFLVATPVAEAAEDASPSYAEIGPGPCLQRALTTQ